MSQGKLFQAAVVALAGFSVVGCVPDFDTLEVEFDAPPPFEATFSQEGLSMVHGTAIAVTVTALADDEELDGRLLLDAFPLVRVLERENDDETSTEPRSFVLLAEDVGSGRMGVSIAGRSGLVSIPVTVSPQQSP
ncbi:hypothetical protein [Chondromyces crocatus]|uniref:Lipoprotein n=1 Tax=Chondromyces crocatus TaxID=52 RepID=A0A0K1EAN9_CHOCO|nr:hypothetical protein [Chondromyces crocatus]AKT37924.1 uncharacterized protein CMC5_020670 [Chondromyces crocatus]